MIILGITDHFTSGAALVVDGRVTAAVNEERLVRSKMVIGFPWRSIETVLQVAGVRPEEIDCVAVASRWGTFLPEYVDFSKGVFGVEEGRVKSLFFALGSRLSFLRSKVPFLESLYYRLRQPVFSHRRRAIQQALDDKYGIRCPVEYVWHHRAHAACAYYASGFDDALVVTLDGSGDGHSSHVYDVANGRLNRLHAVRSFDGIGNYYEYVTHLCGFTASKHEGKITGLSAYGKDTYREILEKFINYQAGTMVNVGNAFLWGRSRSSVGRCPKDLAEKTWPHRSRAFQKGSIRSMCAIGGSALAGATLLWRAACLRMSRSTSVSISYPELKTPSSIPPCWTKALQVVLH